ncbi:MAG: hypothetical protein RI885_2111 [Actinomycetota bacterium]|jgi:hypothetical protein
MKADQARRPLEEALTALTRPEAQSALATFLVRGTSLAEGVLSRVDFEADVAAEVVVDVLAFAASLADRELVPYDPSYQVSSAQALVDDLAQAADLAGLQTRVDGGGVALDTAGEDPAPVAAMAHRVDSASGAAVTVWRVKGPGIATKRPTGIRILVPRSGVYERVTDELVYYQPRFDALVVDDVVFVTAPSTLQRALGSPERARAMARAVFAAATRSVDIEGAADLRDAVGSDPAMIAKMAQLSRTLDADPGYAALLTTRNLLDFLDANPQIPIATAGEGQARHLVFEPSPQTRYLIPKALADDFLRSELTDRRYEAGSKQRIE